MWRYELHPPHLINVATIPCGSRNSENVILPSGILPKKIASNVSCMLHRNGPVDYKMWGVMRQCVYQTKICDIYDLQICLTQTWVDWTERYQGCDWPVTWPSEIIYVCWWYTVWTLAAKLLFICIMWFIKTFCETVNVIWCIWRLFCS